MERCPKCDRLTFGYDNRFKANRCFSINCLWIDYDNEASKLSRQKETPSKPSEPVTAV